MEYWMGSACGMYGGEEKCVQGFGKEARMKEIFFFNIYIFCMLHYTEQHYMHWWFLALSLMYI
jgi:hypothetical protein